MPGNTPVVILLLLKNKIHDAVEIIVSSTLTSVLFSVDYSVSVT